MGFKLRDYQSNCVNTILDNFKTKETQIVQLPTGAGKTVILWHFLKEYDGRAIIVAPTRELIEQIYDTGCEVVGKDKVYLKKKTFMPEDKHLVMTMQALTWLCKLTPEKLPDFDIIIIDEAHRAKAATYTHFIEKYVTPYNRKCLGLTATPERSDGKNLLEVFKKITFSKTLIELIRQNHLVDILCYNVKTDFSLSKFKCHAGDFNQATLNQLDIPKRNGIILDLAKNHCEGKQTLIFGLSVKHCKKLADILSEHGLKASHIAGEMAKSERKRIIQAFKSKEIQFLINCQLLTEGFDEPSIEALVLGRPTRSKTLYCQMIGRGLRPYPGKKECLVYDLSDEHYDITSFNALGNISNRYKEDFLESGRRFSEMVDRIEKKYGSVEYFNYQLEKRAIVSRNDEMLERFDDAPALRHQLLLLKAYGIPHLPKYTTMHEAAYLLWKHRKLKDYGYNQRTAWKEWNCPISCNDTEKRA